MSDDCAGMEALPAVSLERDAIERVNARNRASGKHTRLDGKIYLCCVDCGEFGWFGANEDGPVCWFCRR